MLDHNQNDGKSDEKSMFTATNFDYCVSNGIEITATYFLLPAKASQKAFNKICGKLLCYCYPYPLKCDKLKYTVL